MHLNSVLCYPYRHTESTPTYRTIPPKEDLGADQSHYIQKGNIEMSRKHRDVVSMGTQPLTQKPIRRVIADGPNHGLAHLRNSIKISSSKGTQTIWKEIHLLELQPNGHHSHCSHRLTQIQGEGTQTPGLDGGESVLHGKNVCDERC